MALLPLLRFICDQPLNRRRKVGALLDFARWQIRSRLVNKPMTYRWINNARVLVRRGETGFTFNIYCGLQDFSEMSYLLHVLRDDDLFADVGANIGSYTLLASAVRHSRTICFEPVPETYSRLLQNLRLNDLGERVVAHNLGVGEKPGTLRFSTNQNCGNHVLRDDEKEEALTVKVVTLDEMTADSCPNVLKLDVEGFELPVLRGASGILQNPELHSIILELTGMGHNYGYRDSDIVDLLKQYGFATYGYDPFARKLTPQVPSPGNALFVRGPGSHPCPRPVIRIIPDQKREPVNAAGGRRGLRDGAFPEPSELTRCLPPNIFLLS